MLGGTFIFYFVNFSKVKKSVFNLVLCMSDLSRIKYSSKCMTLDKDEYNNENRSSVNI